MNSELPVSADALLAERARLEEVLQSSEDWCELLRLKSRKDRGEGMSAVNAARLEMVLIDALAEDEDFIRYKAVCVALERLIRGLPPLPPKGEKPPVDKDDLTEIEGITPSMQRRLNALDVTTFMQIAEWSSAEVKSISSDLGIGRQIYEQDWIGQAEELATRSEAPPSPASAPKYVAPQRAVAPPPPRPVEKSEPPVVRETPRPVVVSRPDAKPVEMKPEPVAAKSLPPSAPRTEEKSEYVAPNAEAQPPKPPTAPPPAPVQAKAEQKPDLKPETPPQAPHAKSDAAKDKAPLADPPRPLKPDTYRAGSGDADTSDEKTDAPTRLLPMPPSPLRVQTSAAASQSTTAKPASASASAELGPPPRPFVITRSSLPPLPKTDAPPAPPVIQRQPEPPRSPPPVAPSAIPAKPANGPFAALAALQQPASPASSTPSMSIAEAIAYAAEVARQSPKAPASNNIPDRSQSGAPGNAPASGPINGAAMSAPSPQKLEPARPPAAAPPPPAKPAAAAPAAPSQTRASAPPAAPAIPPPLPEGFVPPPEETVAEPSDYRAGRVQPSRGDRDDFAAQRLGAEEATVEIIVKSAPEVRPTPRATLTKVATETTTTAPRPATPIGRFLKALTGN